MHSALSVRSAVERRRTGHAKWMRSGCRERPRPTPTDGQPRRDVPAEMSVYAAQRTEALCGVLLCFACLVALRGPAFSRPVSREPVVSREWEFVYRIGPSRHYSV